jgi:putative nucleotidyltransferase with HDIG domain
MEKTIGSNVLINKMIATLGELPSSPRIISTIMQLTSDPNTEITTLEKHLSADPSLAAKLLKLSNSAFYGQRKSVSTLKQAILIIGFHTLRSLVVAASIHSLYGKKGKDSIANKLWEHSLATAIACRLLALKVRHMRFEEIFMAGLLHDIGKLVMNQKLDENYENVCRKVETEHQRFHDIERQEFGFTHCDVGMMLLNKWNLPQELINAVYKHHDTNPQECCSGAELEPAQMPIEFILDVGNQLAKQIDFGFNDFRVESLQELAFSKAAGIDVEEYEELKSQLEEEFTQELEMFKD